MSTTFDKLAQHTFSVGVALPLDNDWARFDITKGTPFGRVKTMKRRLNATGSGLKQVSMDLSKNSTQ